MEPQWNPMAEEQALDRVYRIGQTQDVLAIRYIVKDSIEEVRTRRIAIYQDSFFRHIMLTRRLQYVQQIQKSKLDLITRAIGTDGPNQGEVVRERLEVSSPTAQCCVNLTA